jgi:hypothetical protein
MNEWISMKDQIPKQRELVLCCGAKGGMFLGRTWSERAVCDENGCINMDVPNSRSPRYAQYWMYLPELPEYYHISK